MKKQKYLVILFWGGVLALLFVGIILYFDLHKRNTLADTVLVQVNNDRLTAREFSEKLASNLESYDTLLAKDTHVVDFAKNKIVEDFVHSSLITSWAERNSIEVLNSEVDAEVSKIRANYPDEASFKEALNSSQTSLKDWENQIKSKLLQKKVFQSLALKTQVPTDEEIKSFYNTNRETFKERPQVRIRQIVFDNEDAANRLYHSITPSTQLADLAKKYSVAPEAKNGGDVGWIEQGTLDIFDKAFNMRVGQRSGVLKSPYGFHIFEVTGKKAEQTLSFEEVKERISRTLKGNKEQAIYTAWLEEQLKVSKVLKNTEAIKSIQVKPLGE
ncbi:MAG: peptidyl-prolyl cis-trans isomerase [Bdellovibrionota bacterium]